MIDLSNNNSKGHRFSVVYHKGGQRRVFLKRVEGTRFVDETFPGLRTQALKAGLWVGPYDFLHPLEATPAEAVDFFLKHIPELLPGRDLRPCLDAEAGKPSAAVGKWVSQCALLLKRNIGFAPVTYGNAPFLEACEFHSIPGPLWLSSYGRNDGKEHPVDHIPRPWHNITALQFTSVATVAGIRGKCDLSHVFIPSGIDIPPRKKV